MDIEKYLTDAGVPFERHEHETAYTAQEVAAEEHVSGDEVAKPVLVRAGKEYVLCVLPASCKVDLGKLAKVVEVDRCTLAGEEAVAKTFPDVEVGAEPPFGKPYGLRTVVDTRLAEKDRLTFTAGTHRRAVRLRYQDYAALAEPQVADFAVHL